MEHDRNPAQLIADSKGLLLDFDGPICDVYAGSDPARIAREVATEFNLDNNTDDPLDLITHALATGGPVDEIHQALTATEVHAVHSATETPGIRRLIETYDRQVAIVSNNAAEAIEHWLSLAGILDLVDTVTGRDPRHMKPDPQPLAITLTTIGQHPQDCVFIGDSMSDIEAANRAETPIIALANRPTKQTQFETAGCNHVINDMLNLANSN